MSEEKETSPQNDNIMMYASCCKNYGAAEEVFEVGYDLPKPTVVDAKQIIIANYRTSINPADCKQRSGNLRLVVKHNFPLILGQDFAGVVVSVGSGVTKFAVGDEVFGSTAPRNGCSAEFVSAYEHEVSKKPKNISWDEAAASPTAYCTAWKGLFDTKLGNLPMYLEKKENENNNKPSPKQKKKVLVIGASGSVGSAAVQLAVKVASASVSAICGATNKEYVKSLGVEDVFDYKEKDYVKKIQTGSFDLILDCVGGDQYYKDLFSLLRRPSSSSDKAWGEYITCVGPVLHGGSDRITPWTLLSTISVLVPRLLANALLPGRLNPRYKIYLSFSTNVLNSVANVLESKMVDCPRIDTTLPLSELGKGHAMVETGHSNGKVVLNTKRPSSTTKE